MVLILIIAFVIIMYLITFKSIKNKRANKTSTVEEFHANYIQRRKQMQERRESASQQPITHVTTKYNSSEDYREK